MSSVREALAAVPLSAPLEITLWRDDDGMWVALPKGGRWPEGLETDALPICVAGGPEEAVRGLLRMQAGACPLCRREDCPQTLSGCDGRWVL